MKKTPQHPGPAIRAVRRALDLSQHELARRIGRSPSYVSNFEHARIPAKAGEVIAIRRALKQERHP